VTFAALAGREQNWIADRIGHTTPHCTFSVCQQVHRRRYVDEQAIWELTPFADEPAARASPRQATRSASASQRLSDGPMAKSSGWDALLKEIAFEQAVVSSSSRRRRASSVGFLEGQV
jgi:hypothetical protein